MCETTCPTISPSIEEFRDFKSFVERIDAEFWQFGLVKVIPPKEWIAGEFNVETVDNFMVNRPIMQHPAGRAGIFRLDLVERPSLSISEFRQLASLRDCSTLDACQKERKFWKELSSVMDPPSYGADVEGSIFEHVLNTSSSLVYEPAWNLNRIDSILREFIAPQHIPGVTSSMVYVGMFGATFAWHTEDYDLNSINYLHYGQSKSWYCVSPLDHDRFKHACNYFWFGREENESIADDYDDRPRKRKMVHEGGKSSKKRGVVEKKREICTEFIRHKNLLVSPSRLTQSGIPYLTCVQNAGEFVITFPSAFHAGFNHGFNVAEATNFATPRWIPIGATAGVCKCKPYAVQMNVDWFESLYRNKYMKQDDDDDGGSWLVRCPKCATRASSMTRNTWAKRNGANDAVFLCDYCNCWAHVKCVFSDYFQSFGGSMSHITSEIASSNHAVYCDVCWNMVQSNVIAVPDKGTLNAMYN